MLERALVVISADHGEELLEHGWVGHASTGYDAKLEDALLRIPLIVRVPGAAHAGRYRALASQVDVMPTLFELLGIAAPELAENQQGVSLALVLRGKKREVRDLVFAETTRKGWTTPRGETHDRLVAVRRAGSRRPRESRQSIAPRSPKRSAAAKRMRSSRAGMRSRAFTTRGASSARRSTKATPRGASCACGRLSSPPPRCAAKRAACRSTRRAVRRSAARAPPNKPSHPAALRPRAGRASVKTPVARDRLAAEGLEGAMERFRERVAVVTGAASGIGRAMARRFAAEGMSVVIADVEAGPLADVEKALAVSGTQVLARVCDVAREASVCALADAAVERFGAVHVVCNNAGVVTAGPTHELSQQDWDWVMGVNLWGPIYGVRAFLPILLKQDEAHILSTASTAGLVAGLAIAPYNVSKFGVVALMETLARELVNTKVGVSVLCPGPINTRIPQSERNRPADKQVHTETAAERRFYASAGPMLAAGMDPAEVADLVLRAIRENRFWILTHPEMKDVLRKRVELLAASDALIPPRPKA